MAKNNPKSNSNKPGPEPIAPVSPLPVPQDNPTPSDLPLGVGVRAEIAQFQGPIPPPSTLAGYNMIDPGFADRILSMAEQQAKHRQSLETLIVSGENTKSIRAQPYAAGIAITGLIIGGICVYTSSTTAQAVAGATIAGVPLLGIVVAFLKGTEAHRNERERKSAEVQKIPK